jgi:uncharacterized membrane protein YccF (DUF307 family)
MKNEIMGKNLPIDKRIGNIMNLIGNIIWLLLGGLIAAAAWSLAGLILCITIIGIPFGIQHFKFAQLGLIPFGAEIKNSK